MISSFPNITMNNEMLYMVPHTLIGGLFMLSVFPKISDPLKLKFQISAHAVLAILFAFAAQQFLKPTINGSFTNIHGFIQAFCSSLHVGAGYFLWKTQKLGKPERSVIFSRLISSFICLIFRLFAYMHIIGKSAKGLELSNQYLYCVAFTDGLWFLSEVIRMYYTTKTNQDEIEAMVKRTTLWVEGKCTFYIENAFYLDAGLTLSYAIIHIAFPQHVLSLILKPENKLDSHHYLWCRLFGALNLMPAVTSMCARFYSPEMQTSYIASRLLVGACSDNVIRQPSFLLHLFVKMQSNTDSSTSGTYSQTVGLLYVFNLIVGTGALALPKAFQTAGWLLSITLLTFSAFMSYVAATFVIEALSVANAVLSKKRRVEYDDVVVADGPSTFEISKKVEVSEMASMFLSKVSLVFSYFAIIIYLFGDLAIYSTTVPKSAMNIVCATINASTVKSSDPCHESWPEILTRMTVYRFFVIIFVVVVCLPMVIAGITKTRHIQIMTTLSRWAAFILMISLATMQLSSDGAAAHPPAYNFHGFGSLFGCAVYAFMCHHSIPSLITPMRTKDNVFGKIALVYGVVGVFYFTLSLTGAFAFEHVQDIYTLNFFHDGNTSFIYSIIDYFLALFPIITLTSSYPIIALTLINNFNVVKDILCPKVGQENESLLEADSLVEDNDTDDEREARNARNEKSVFDVLVPALVLALPTFLSLLTDDMLLLASITGSFPGVAVQFAIPCLLVTAARKHARSVLNFPVPRKNNSPFQSPIWIVLISSWAGFSMIMVLLNLVGVKF